MTRRPTTQMSILAVLLAALAAVATAAPAPAPADDPAVAALAAKGVTFKKDKAGTVTEASFGGKTALDLDGWKAVGQIKTITRASFSGGSNWPPGTVAPPGDPLNDETARAIAGLVNVETFFSNGSEMTDDGFKAFAGWTKLRSFGLDHWFGPKGGKAMVGPGLAHLKDLPNLEHVRLGGCRVDNRACDALALCKTLQSVDLGHTFAVTDDGVAALKALPKLRVVKLSPQFTPRITDASLAHLGQVPTLEEVHVSETILTYDDGFAHLKGLKNLKLVMIPNVVATEADVARLRADHPDAKVEWTPAPPEQAAKAKAAFARAKANPPAK